MPNDMQMNVMRRNGDAMITNAGYPKNITATSKFPPGFNKGGYTFKPDPFFRYYLKRVL